MLITYEEYTAMMGNAEADREKTEAALDAAGEMIEKWLHRKILQGEYTDEFVLCGHSVLLLELIREDSDA